MSWFESFGFSSDPFLTSVLRSEEEFNTLLIKTHSIETNIKYITSQVKKEPFLSLLVGERGIGKSTALQYISYLCRKEGILSIYFGPQSYELKTGGDPSFELSKILIRSIINNIIDSIYTEYKNIFLNNKRKILNCAKIIGKEYDEIEGFYTSSLEKYDYSLLNALLDDLIKLIQENSLNVLLCFDNLDKIDIIPIETLMTYLGGGYAQPLFEKLRWAGVSILISIDPEASKIIRKKEDLSYVRNYLYLETLKPQESIMLIKQRVEKLSNKKLHEFCDEEVIIDISHKTKGNTRKIIQYMGDLFKKAHKDNIPFITKNVVTNVEKSFNERETYYKIVENEEASNGAKKLLSIKNNIKDDLFDAYIKSIINIYKKRASSILPEISDFLVEHKFIYTESGRKIGSVLDKDVYILFTVVEEKNWDLNDFIKYIYDSDDVLIASYNYFGINMMEVINEFITSFRELNFDNKEINILKDKQLLTFNKEKWRAELISKQFYLKDNIIKLTNIDVEEMQYYSIIKLLHVILREYLLQFTRTFIMMFDSQIYYKSNVNYIYDWNFIYAGIKEYQNKHNYYFMTYQNINKIRQYYSNNKIKKEFTYSELNSLIHGLADLISEFNKQFEYSINIYLGDMNKTNPNKLDLINDALIKISALNEKTDCIKYEENNILLDYVNKNYDKNTYYSFKIIPYKIAYKNIVKNNKNYLEYYIYIIIGLDIKLNSKNIIDVLIFLDVITVYLDSQNINTYLKPKFFVHITSIQGYETSAIRFLNFRKKNPRMDIKIGKIDELNKILKKNGIDVISNLGYKTLIDYEYYKIVEIIYSFCTATEWNYTTFSKLGENDLRNQILSTLNTHYPGNITSETFNGKGKTDILLRRSNENVFIAECKIWYGPSIIHTAIDQLIQYVTWKDIKTSLIIFNKNKDPSNILLKIEDEIKSHKLYNSQIDYSDYIIKKENLNVYSLKHPKDTKKSIILSLMLFDLPIE